MKALLDTNVIIALIVEDDVNHGEAGKIWRQLEKCLLSTITIIELAYFLIKHNINLDIIEQIITDPKIELVEITYHDIIFLLRHKDRIKGYDDLNDLLILSSAIKKKTPLITFDKELQKLTKEIQH